MLLSDNDIAIEYLYSFVRNKGNNALIVFRVADIEKAQDLLRAHNVNFLSQEEICNV